MGDRQVLALSGLAGADFGRRAPAGADVGIDLVAVKHDGSRVAIQCKSRSGTGAVTITQVQKLGGAAPKPMFAERWMVVDAHWSAATEDAAAVAG